MPIARIIVSQHLRIAIVVSAALACLQLGGCAPATAHKDRNLTESAQREEFRPMAVDRSDLPASYDLGAARRARPTTRGVASCFSPN
ncbi:MAG: hypothetical protein U0587_11860 [Candidatus Binatia bacterium]